MTSQTDFDGLWAKHMERYGYGTPDEYTAQGWSAGRILQDLRDMAGRDMTPAELADVANSIAAGLEERGYPTLQPVDVDTVTLTTARAESSYGVPVLVLDGTAYGPGDVVPTGQTAAELVRQWAERFIGQ